MSIAHDLSDAEFDELDDLLAATPEPLEPLDASMLDGYLAGVLVQPRLIPIEEWLPPVFDYEGRELPDDVDPAWLARIRGLVERRFASLNQSMLEQGWFYPVVLDLDADEGATAEEGENAAEVVEAAAEGVEADAIPLPEDPITRALLPWVGGFEYAAVTFPDRSPMRNSRRPRPCCAARRRRRTGRRSDWRGRSAKPGRCAAT